MHDRLDTAGIRTYSLYDRESKVKAGDFGRPADPSGSFAEFLDTLPRILAAGDLRAASDAIASAKRRGRKFVIGMGAHVIKVGLSPLVIDLMERGIVDAVAMNGAGVIHDTEIAMVRHTSEDVAKEIANGTFGMVKETAEFICTTVKEGVAAGVGLGEAVGAAIDAAAFPGRDLSILAAAYRLGKPATVHVAIGTDIIHMHPSFDGAAFGEASHRDFLAFANLVAGLDGGVYLNLGSSVIMPEVFLKAVSLARNLGYPLRDVTTINMDFIQQYRPLTNVVRRPTLEGGRGFAFTGHHEIMFPLLCTAVRQAMGGKE